MGEAIGTSFLILICVGSANTRVLMGLSPGKSDVIQYPPLYFLTIACAFGLGEESSAVSVD